jgi:hypothetical protein
MANLAQAIQEDLRESSGAVAEELAPETNEAQVLLIGGARHILRHWEGRKSRQVDRMLANFTELNDLTTLGLSEAQIDRLAEMSVKELGAALCAVL